MNEFETRCDVLKVDDQLGLVFGFGIVCKRDGEDYYDLQGDHIPEEAMVKAAADFMLNSRVAGDMHRAKDGQVVFAFPLTEDVAKAFDIQTPITGLMVAIQPSEDVLTKFRSGEYTGFSIGGVRVAEEVVDA